MGLQNMISGNKLILLLQKPMGERLEIASLNTLLGLLIVFTVLILITLIIYMFRIIPYLKERNSNKQEKDNSPVDTVINQIEEQEDMELVTDDSELVAVITAAICAAAGEAVPSDGLVVRSIRKVNRRR